MYVQPYMNTVLCYVHLYTHHKQSVHHTQYPVPPLLLQHRSFLVDTRGREKKKNILAEYKSKSHKIVRNTTHCTRVHINRCLVHKILTKVIKASAEHPHHSQFTITKHTTSISIVHRTGALDVYRKNNTYTK